MSSARRSRARQRGALGAVLGLAVGLVAAPAGAAPRPDDLRVAISVPSALASNGRQVWLANTGTSSVLELSATTGRELKDVAGKVLRLDNSHSVVQYGNDVWVANEASDTVTEFYARSGALKHVLAGPRFHFAVPVSLVVADGHVFVLDVAGDKVTMVNERTAHLVRYLDGRRYHFDRVVGMVRDGNDVWVASAGGGGTLTELSAATGGVLRVVPARAGHLHTPTAIGFDGTRLLVTNAQGRAISLLRASDGTYLGTLTTSKVDLDRATSIATVDGTVWIASTTSAYVLGLRGNSGVVVRAYRHRFGYPVVFADAHHVWVVDRLQSRVTELSPKSGWPLRVIVN